MFDSYNTYIGLAGLINSLETEQDVKVFLSKYKKWYVQEKHLDKMEAENKIKLDLQYCIEKFRINKNLAEQFRRLLNISVI